MDIKIRITVVVVLGSTVTVLVAVLCILWAVPDLPEISLTVKLCLPLMTNGPADLQCGDMVDIMHNYVQQTNETTYEDLQKQEDKKNKESEVSDRSIGLEDNDDDDWQRKPAVTFTGRTQKKANGDKDLQVGRTIQNGYEWLYREFHVQPTFGSEQVVYAIPLVSSEMIVATGNNNTHMLPYVPFPSNVIPWNGEAIPDEYDEEFRLNSLHSFCFKDNLKPSLENLAASGFYCTQDSERRCAFCNVFYPFNHRGNDAHSIHRRICPTCPMVNNE